MSLVSRPASTPRVPQQARSRRTRRAVLDAAGICFEQHGYDETTTAVIARQAGIAVGTLYGYFRDKSDILLEIVEETLEQLSELVVSRLDAQQWDASDPRDVVRDLIDTVFHTQRMRPGLQRIIWERQFKDDDFRRRIDGLRAPMRRAIRECAGELAHRGLLRDVDPRAAADVVLNAVQWNAAHAFMYGTPAWIDQAARETADMVGRYLFRD